MRLVFAGALRSNVKGVPSSAIVTTAFISYVFTPCNVVVLGMCKDMHSYRVCMMKDDIQNN